MFKLIHLFKRLVEIKQINAAENSLTDPKNTNRSGQGTAGDVEPEKNSSERNIPGAANVFDSKRKDVISWKEYFMGIAILSSKRSKFQVGACVVDEEKRIVGVGFNGMPVGDSGDELPWDKNESDEEVYEPAHICHAAMNAIINRNPTSMKNCTLYITHFPCKDCSKILVQSGIKKVIHLNKIPKEIIFTASRILLDNANVKHEEYFKKSVPREEITLIYEETAANPDDSNKADDDGGKSEISGARNDPISREKYFMGIAILSKKRSRDPNTQVGACVVNKQNRIVGVGYNGMPIGCSDDLLPWGKNPPEDKKYLDKMLYVCHAEMNAIVSKNPTSKENCIIYVTLFPCVECAKVLIQSGIKKVIYLSDEKSKKKEYMESKELLKKAKITPEPYFRGTSKREEVHLIYKEE